MKIPLENVKVELSNHAMRRFRERIDPTATKEQILGYFAEAVILDRDVWLRKFGLFGLLTVQGTVAAVYRYVKFLIKKSKAGRGIVIVTVMKVE